jgi:site-specific DNA recombinase
VSSRKKGSNMLCSLSGGMPSPVSWTSMLTVAARRLQPTRMRPPGGVWSTALRARLRKIPSSSTGWLMITTLVRRVRNLIPFRRVAPLKRSPIRSRTQLAANTSHHRRRATAAEPSLLAGLLVDAQGERLTPSHAVKKGRRYRYYVSAALITEVGADRARGWRLAAREIEEAVIRILADALTSPARSVERFGAAAMPSDQIRKMLGRVAGIAATLNGSPEERVKLVRGLVDKVVVDEKTITIKLRRGLLLGEGIPSSASEAASEDAVELTAAAAFTRRGAETKLVLPGLEQPKHSSRCDPALIKAIARGRAWFEELAIGRGRSLRELAKRDGISRRYIRRLIGLAFLSPQLVETILQGRQSVELTATRLTELDLPLDWTEQHKLLAG